MTVEHSSLVPATSCIMLHVLWWGGVIFCPLFTFITGLTLWDDIYFVRSMDGTYVSLMVYD